jgi:hypothetical protein
MEARYYLTCLWPGLAEVWWRGRLTGLPAAVAFTFALNLYLIARYLYPEWIAGGLVSIGFWVGLLVWAFYVIHSIREVPGLIAPRSVSEKPDRFPEAQAAYLRGEWPEAEGLLTDVLAIEPRDPPALMLLAGVYRYTGRLEAATLLMNEIRRLEVADSWWLEVQAESRRLESAIARSKRTSGDGESDPEPHADGPKTDSDVDSDAADMTANRPAAA